MAKKLVKKTVSKGERLGWVSMAEVKSISLSSIVVKGRRVRRVRQQSMVNEVQPYLSSLLIP